MKLLTPIIVCVCVGQRMKIIILLISLNLKVTVSYSLCKCVKLKIIWISNYETLPQLYGQFFFFLTFQAVTYCRISSNLSPNVYLNLLLLLPLFAAVFFFLFFSFSFVSFAQPTLPLLSKRRYFFYCLKDFENVFGYNNRWASKILFLRKK